MKAMILAAGRGTRLLPYTNHTPKPLFPVLGRPLLDHMIKKLIAAGCEAIIINLHHLHQLIETFLAEQKYGIPIHTRYEPTILGTGGGIKNVADFWDNDPFMVINGDIITDIDLKQVYEFHCRHCYPVTLVLCDNPEFNSVLCSKDGLVTAFEGQFKAPDPSYAYLTFTGIQVLDPEVLRFIPEDVPASSIEAYKKMIATDKKIRAYIPSEGDWKDMGTPQRYKEAIFKEIIPEVVQRAFPGCQDNQIQIEHLEGDGSERQWHRLKIGQRSLIMSDHGIRRVKATTEVDSFVNIGRHLYRIGLPVPKIYYADTFTGLVFLEDLGNINLQTAVQSATNRDQIISMYQSVIKLLIQLSISGAQGFDTAWTYQTPRYSKNMILERECRYFVDAFLNGYLGLEVHFEDFRNAFEFLADNALGYSVEGFMHRDFQSRNIMVKNNRFYLIDFQGGRLGPIQYDLASVLIDPYVKLSDSIQNQLLEYCIETLSSAINVNAEMFRHSYTYCALARNLQILGAFAHLSTVKGKAYFKAYFPAALRMLYRILAAEKSADFIDLNLTVKSILNNSLIISPAAK
jgi:NDP-sugar pyrophosphorylase family protein